MAPRDRQVLTYIEANPGCTRQAIADDAGLLPVSICAPLHRLMRAGRVVREPWQSERVGRPHWLYRTAQQNRSRSG